jgi:hypothetical protein
MLAVGFGNGTLGVVDAAKAQVTIKATSVCETWLKTIEFKTLD